MGLTYRLTDTYFKELSPVIEKLSNGVAILLICSVLMLPPIPVSPSLPKLFAADFLLPLILILLVLRGDWKERLQNKFVFLTLIYISFILLSILFNIAFNSYRDWFEIIKYIKFLSIFLFIGSLKITFDYKKIFRYVFYFILIFNFLHYFDVMNFNQIIEPFYASGVQLKYFGINTLGQPDAKRMLGTLGNPNNNSILFLFFCILFFPKNHINWKNDILFFLSFISLIACQSRTGFLAFLIVFPTYILLNKISIKRVLINLLVLGICFFSFSFAEFDAGFLRADQAKGTKYLSTLASDDLENTSSVTGRIEVWKYLWGMIKEKPFLGHGPYKNYFYNNKLYSENQYMLKLWRYGFVGLSIFMLWLLYPLYHSYKHRFSPTGSVLFYFTIGVIIVSFTNNPISEPTIFILFAIILALYFNKLTYNFTDEKAFIDRK
jgi:O-antigen ligase